jgi:hypothetical protein
MRSFRIEIIIPQLSERASPSESIWKRFLLLIDMTIRVAEYLETIVSRIKSLDIVINIHPILTQPIKHQSQMIDVILYRLWRVWSVKKLKLYLAFMPGQTANAPLFDILEDSSHKVEQFVSGDSSLLQEKLKEWRMRITRARGHDLSKIYHQTPRIIPRTAVYQLEAVIEAFHHPLFFSFVSLQAKQIQAAHHSAIIAEYKQDIQAFQGACEQIFRVLDTYSEEHANIRRTITQKIEGIKGSLQPSAQILL